jgi:hypothetical protein
MKRHDQRLANEVFTEATKIKNDLWNIAPSYQRNVRLSETFGASVNEGRAK